MQHNLLIEGSLYLIPGSVNSTLFVTVILSF